MMSVCRTQSGKYDPSNSKCRKNVAYATKKCARMYGTPNSVLLSKNSYKKISVLV